MTITILTIITITILKIAILMMFWTFFPHNMRPTINKPIRIRENTPTFINYSIKNTVAETQF